MTRAPQGAAAVAARVVDWHRRSGRRGLPWQGVRDPYRVWLSEVMLQQTQVATASAYFERFVATFPDVAALAAAPLDDVLALWSGLGYYSRARNLHRCAQVVVEQHGGRFPRSSAELARLPGIGRSTAAAIAAFCFDERAAILDGNVKRVLARSSGFAGDLATAAAQRELWAYAQSLLPSTADMPHYTQGLMDLGATVCLARQPRCDECPLATGCVAHKTGRTGELPRKSRRTQRGRRSHALLWLRHREDVLLVRRPERGVWAGLWSLPEFADLRAARAVATRWRGKADALPAVDHALTHFDWHLQPLRCELPVRTAAATREAIAAALGGRWVETAEALRMGLPAPVRRLLGEQGG
ncbi:MAG TPA: A/G-specific adenine glycosylase, partial [Burkholderiaceae bacterium]|nr:A/G-specific adenine glycosylase [Burkholderiaceae bacterium]